jgi:hypothetical protein
VFAGQQGCQQGKVVKGKLFFHVFGVIEKTVPDLLFVFIPAQMTGNALKSQCLSYIADINNIYCCQEVSVHDLLCPKQG